MGLLGAASDKVQYELLPTGEYVFTLWNLTLESGQWGDQIKWVYLISEVTDPDTYILRGEGVNAQEKELWQFSKIGLPKGSRAREWSEALLGRELRLGEEPEDDDLIRHRMVAYLIHKPKKTDPSIKQEAIAEGSAKPYQPARSAARPAAGLPSQPTQAEVDAELAASDELRAKTKKLIRNASLDDIDELPTWGPLDDLDLSNLADADHQRLQQAIKQAMLAAV